MYMYICTRAGLVTPPHTHTQVRGESEPLHDIPSTFFAISAAAAGFKPQNFVLSSPETYTPVNCGLPAGMQAHVSPHSVHRLQTLPGIKGLSLTGRYPVADVKYDIPGFPVQVALEAYSPLIPLDNKSSSLPCAVFTFSLKNTDPAKAATVRVMEAQSNFVGWDGQTDCSAAGAGGKTFGFWGGNVNTPMRPAGASAGGLAMARPATSAAIDPAFNGTIAVDTVSTPGVTTGVLPQATTEADLFAQFVGGKEVPPVSAPTTAPSAAGTTWFGGVVQSVTVPAGGSASVTFVLGWHFPNRMLHNSVGKSWDNQLPARLGNRYNTWFKDATAVSGYMIQNFAPLRDATRLYRDTMFGSTVPAPLLDSAAGRVAHMRCPTMWWTEDGIVMGTEGNGCCPLNCSHVYGYTTLMERLFPDLAKVRSWALSWLVLALGLRSPPTHTHRHSNLFSLNPNPPVL